MKSLKSRTRKSALPQGGNAPDLTVREQELHERIAQEAYELYEKRGHAHGCDVEDWLEAERLVVDQLGNQRSTSKESPKRAKRSKELRSSEAR